MSIHTASDGCKIFYEVTGQGAPLVLIPGLGGDGRFWSPVVRRLEKDFRVISVDHRGAGRSDRPGEGYSIARIAADVFGILDQEGVPRAHIAGHSTGGAVAQVMALRQAERLASCTISSSWLKADARFRTLFKLRQNLLREEKFEAYQELTHVLGYPPDWMDSHQSELAETVAKARQTLSPAAVQIARIAMLLAHDTEQQAEAISTPTLVIGAVDDAMLPLSYSEHIASRIQGAQLAKVKGGHFHPRTEPEQFAALVHSFAHAITS